MILNKKKNKNIWNVYIYHSVQWLSSLFCQENLWVMYVEPWEPQDGLFAGRWYHKEGDFLHMEKPHLEGYQDDLVGNGAVPDGLVNYGSYS